MRVQGSCCLLVVLLTGLVIAQDCPAPAVLGPCVCMLDNNGFPALQCSAVASGSELAQVFANVQVTYFSSVDIIQSPGVTDLPPSVFSEVGVGAVRFYNTGLQTINPSAFSPTTARQVTTLYVKHNNEFNVFNNQLPASLPQLESLFVSYTGVSSLDAELGATSLPYLDLGHNNISQISPNYFASASNLSVLLLPFNSLSSLAAGSLAITSMADGFFLDLGWNSLSQGISIDVFGGFGAKLPKELILSGNGMTTLLQENLEPILAIMDAAYGQNAYLLLDHNPLACDCSMAWVVNSLTKRVMQQAQCRDGRLVNNLVKEDFAAC